MHKFTARFAPRWESSPGLLVDRWKVFPTGWGQGGKDSLDAAGERVGLRFDLFSAGQIRQGALVPAFHRPTTYRNLIESNLF